MARGLFAAFCLLRAGGFAALGVWQVERRAGKLQLIAKADARIHAVLGPLPPPVRWSRDLASTRGRLGSVFRHNRAAAVQAATDDGAGWRGPTPLEAPAAMLLADRGSISSKRRDPGTRTDGQPNGRAMATGLLRASEPGSVFLRHNDPAANPWYSRDAAAGPGGWTVGSLTVVAFRNNHLIHAVTWVALAGLTLIGAAMPVRAGRG